MTKMEWFFPIHVGQSLSIKGLLQVNSLKLTCNCVGEAQMQPLVHNPRRPMGKGWLSILGLGFSLPQNMHKGLVHGLYPFVLTRSNLHHGLHLGGKLGHRCLKARQFVGG